MRLAVDIKTIVAEKMLPVSQTELYRMVADKRLKSVRVGKRILIPMAAIEEFLRDKEVDGDE